MFVMFDMYFLFKGELKLTMVSKREIQKILQTMYDEYMDDEIDGVSLMCKIADLIEELH